MPESLLTVLRLVLLGLIWLFFVRVLWLMRTGPQTTAAAAAPAPASRAAAAPPTPRADPSKPAVRVVSAGALKGKEFVVSTEATVGRAPGCQVLLTDPMVSQLHARLFRAGTDLHVEDLGSSNGTFLNGRKIGPAAKLKRGDRLRFGPVEVEVLG